MSDVINQKQALLKTKTKVAQPSKVQRMYLMRGLDQPGGKLPLFDVDGQRYKAQTIQSCIKNGWCEQWYENPIKPDWLTCKLTDHGRTALKAR